ncbi:MAG: pyrroline-5-carboxylate reductase [Gammaproteobacteria bacterium]|nr:pyrroline-5-carboxylate reductase [Gammaproteobacteria bacterium]MYD76398.1 pyrroline-5-carboxylate reductase [Gammaproteobacteria bacterium]
MNVKLAFVGGGNMARSIVGGLVANDYDPALIRVSDPLASQREMLSKRFPVRTAKSNLECIDDADIVIMAIKPQVMKTALESIRSHLQPSSQLMISIAAGIRIEDIMRWSGCKLPLVRVMPNTPALIGCGASVLCANDIAQDFHKKMAESVMRAVGEVAWIDSENDMDAVTGISGSGPAYFFRVMEIMIEAAEKNGLDPKLSKSLVLQTALGAARLAQDSPLSPGELRKQVTSKRGTTEAALEQMENSGIATIFEAGITAAVDRSRELALEMGRE